MYCAAVAIWAAGAPKVHIQIPLVSYVGYFEGTLQLLWQELLRMQ